MMYLRASFVIFTLILASIIFEVKADDIETCGANEEFKNCGTHCQKTCADIGENEKPCDLMCVVGCFCQDGYVRQHDNNSPCIQQTDC